jgi:integrase/recombinase XerC
MFLHRRKSSGVFYLHFRDESGRQRSVSTRARKKSDALQFLKSFREREQEKLRRIQNISLSDFTKEYLTYSKSIHTASSNRSARSVLGEILRILGDMPMAKIGIREAENLIAEKRRVSEHSARLCHATVSAAFSKALDWGYVPENVFKKVKKPRVPETEPLYFTREEFIKLTRVIDNTEWLHLVTVAVSTGMRLGELLNLRWEQVDINNRLIHVMNGNGFTTKSKKNRRLPMTDILVQIFTERREQAVCELVFHRRGHKAEPGYISKRFKKYVRAAGVNPRLRFHSLRHTTASWMVQSGVSVYQVQAVLGHANVATTQRYAHLQPSNLADAVSRLQVPQVSDAA